MYSSEKTMLLRPIFSVGKYAVIIALAALISCGKKTGDEKASQSIVRINGDEITMYQLNNELQRLNPKPEQLAATTMQVTSALIDRQILIQEAKKVDIDRKPRVVQAIENAKMQIISQAYLEDKIALGAKPSAAEIIEYRSLHADIFTHRKIFTLDDVSFNFNTSNAQEMATLMASAKSIEEVKLWLNSHQAKYIQNRAEHASESIPPILLAKLEKMTVGDLVFTHTKETTSVLHLVNIQDAAISETDSKPIIEQILLNKKRAEMIDAEIKRLHRTASIEYLNKKFEPAKIVKTEVSAETIKPVVNVEAKDGFEKGLSGLK